MKETVIKNIEEIRDNISHVNLQLFMAFGCSSLMSSACSLLSLYLFYKNQNTESIVAAAFSGASSCSAILSVVGIFGSVSQYHDEVRDIFERNDNIVDEECPLIQFN